MSDRATPDNPTVPRHGTVRSAAVPDQPRAFAAEDAAASASWTQPARGYLSFADREEIALARAADESMRTIAVRVGRSPTSDDGSCRFDSTTGGPNLRA